MKTKKWEKKRKRDRFGGKMTICSLTDAPNLIEQYVALRNSCARQLFSAEVGCEETLKWLDTKEVVVQIACDGERLLGAAVLYIEKDGEIAVFVKLKRHGVATALLESLKCVAKEKNMQKIWAWAACENEPSKNLFIKSGFKFLEKSEKSFEALQYSGEIFKMEIE